MEGIQQGVASGANALTLACPPAGRKCRAFWVTVAPRDGRPFTLHGIYPGSFDAWCAGMERGQDPDARIDVEPVIQLTRAEGWAVWPRPLHWQASEEAHTGWHERAAAEALRGPKQ